VKKLEKSVGQEYLQSFTIAIMIESKGNNTK